MVRRFLSATLAIAAFSTANAQSVDPTSISLTLEDGQMQTVEVSWSFEPLCFRAFEVDVVPSDPDVGFQNLTGVLVNGCGGETSTFEVSFTGAGTAKSFNLQFVDAEFGGVLGTIPTRIAPAGAAGSVHGFKWLDENGNGRRDRGEPGLAGVTIYADLNANGALDRDEPATVSMRDDPLTDFDETGRYWLEGLKPSRYIIREVVSPEFAQTFPRDGRHHVAVRSGEVIEDVDFGNERLMPGSVHGLKWRDVNGNARRDDDEPGLPGVVIYVDRNGNGQLDADEPQTRTMADDPDTAVDESGRYWLTGLQAGRHVVREVVPQGFVQTFPPCDGSHVVILADGAAVDGVDFGNQPPPPPGSIHGTKWRDSNGNARRDAKEPGLPGVTIYLDLNGNGELDSGEPVSVTMRDNPNTSVDESGHYWLRVPEPGAYIVREVVPDGFKQTFPLNGAGHRVRLESGAVVEGIDFGNWRVPAISIHGTKWHDANANARRDGDEPGLAGVTIYLDLNRNGALEQDEPQATTMRDDPNTDFDEAGLYWLKVREPGRYLVREIVPDGFVQTFPVAPILSTAPVDPRGHEVMLDYGEVVEGIDFGNRRKSRALIHGTKWLDVNGNARRDTNEPGLAGVTIYADRNANGALDRGEPATRTMRDDPDTDFDETGLYWLEVTGGVKQMIREVVPDGFRQTFPGGNGSHVVAVEDGDALDGVDFGNQRRRRCDIDLNQSVDLSDIHLILAVRNAVAPPGEPRDVNEDGFVNVLDARICVAECDRARCQPATR